MHPTAAWQIGVTTEHRVLLVEDNLLVLESIHENLEELGYGVQSVTNGHEALEWLAKQRFDVALVDLLMFPMDGAQLIHHAIRLQPDLAVVVMSGLANVFEEYEFPERTQFLPKPFTGVTLDAVLKAAMDVRQQVE